MQMTYFFKDWLISLIYPKHLTLLIMIFCYMNYGIMELEATVINGSPVTSLIVNSTLELLTRLASTTKMKFLGIKKGP